ncbi:MAG: hypothetical protein IJ301_03380 [Clostridia bacterium]|nr:hypothetical protein [Clostridia bacterium]
MAESKKSSSSSSKKKSWSLNEICFYVIGAVAILYLLGVILAACGLGAVVGWLQGVATAIMISIVAFLGWKFVASKPMVWKVLYVVFLLVVLIGIIIPLVL